jgi:3',5'-cyclic AMP phosphodiesterase CpdA
MTQQKCLCLFAAGLAAGLAAPLAAHEDHPHEGAAAGWQPVAHDAAEAHAPQLLPDRIILTWDGDPATSQAVTWRTDTTVQRAVAEVAVATDHGKALEPARVEAVTTLLASDLGEAHYHSAAFTGLEPGMLYAYRVGDGVNWSEWFHFRTASAEAKPFTFIYFGDAQNDIRTHWSRVFREAFRDAPRAAFTLHAGDLVNRANNDAEWGEWHAAPAWVNATIPVIAATGNHEYIRNPEDRDGERLLSRHWRPQFAFPVQDPPPGFEETCYYIDYQGARIIVLDSMRNREAQAVWLRGVLEDNPQRWTIITFHHPVFSPAKNRDVPALRQLWKPLLDEFKVDLVLSGHDHTYARSGDTSGRSDVVNVPEGYQQAYDPQVGTVYVVSVSGPKMYDLGYDGFAVRTAEDTQLYQVITVDGDELRYEARTATGKLYDTFTLRKRPGQPNALLEALPPENRRPPRQAE